jgi:hypothetical protein
MFLFVCNWLKYIIIPTAIKLHGQCILVLTQSIYICLSLVCTSGVWHGPWTQIYLCMFVSGVHVHGPGHSSIYVCLSLVCTSGPGHSSIYVCLSLVWCARLTPHNSSSWEIRSHRRIPSLPLSPKTHPPSPPPPSMATFSRQLGRE